jgi:magnesium-transporting ATPase (P-type)
MVKSYNLRPEYVGRNRFPGSFTVVRTFDYDHNLKRSSVIVRSSEGDLYLLTKGAPEEIQEISKLESLPGDYPSKLFYLTSLGYRLIGFAFAKLSEGDLAVDRLQLENGLTFLGLISNESFIRAGALKTLRNLCDAQYKLIMATGDNLYTGISVALQTGLIHSDMVIYTLHELDTKDRKTTELQWVNYQKLTKSHSDFIPYRESKNVQTEFDTPDITPSLDALMNSKQKVVLAMTADGYEALKRSMEPLDERYRASLTHFIQTRGLIYARCRPVQKRRLIEDFKTYEKAKNSIVMFVGDEANDAEAIDVADISFLMKRSHLSFRASFTSRNSDFSAVEALVREGKCSMESGFLTFKFFLFMTSLQLVAMIFLLRYFVGLNTAQNIVLDVVLSLFFSDYINSFQASTQLTYSLPEPTMFNFQFMCNLALHSLAGIFTIVLGYLHLTKMSFYRTPFEIIPWGDQRDNNMSLDTHQVYEGVFFFNSIVLLQLFFFLFTNLKSRYRVSLIAQRDSLYYTIFCVTLFFHLASLSEIDEPSWTDQVLINWFNIGKTFGLLWLYVKMLLIYCCLAYLIEVSLEISFAFRGRLHFAQQKKLFVQCRDDPDAPPPKTPSPSAN